MLFFELTDIIQFVLLLCRNILSPRAEAPTTTLTGQFKGFVHGLTAAEPTLDKMNTLVAFAIRAHNSYQGKSKFT